MLLWFRREGCKGNMKLVQPYTNPTVQNTAVPPETQALKAVIAQGTEAAIDVLYRWKPVQFKCWSKQPPQARSFSSEHHLVVLVWNVQSGFCLHPPFLPPCLHAADSHLVLLPCFQSGSFLPQYISTNQIFLSQPELYLAGFGVFFHHLMVQKVYFSFL